MEKVTTSVNEAERRKIIFEAIRDLEVASDLWEKDGVDKYFFHLIYSIKLMRNMRVQSTFCVPPSRSRLRKRQICAEVRSMFCCHM